MIVVAILYGTFDRSALQEISASMSKENLDFLRQRGHKDLQQTSIADAATSRSWGNQDGTKLSASHASGPMKANVLITDIRNQTSEPKSNNDAIPTNTRSQEGAGLSSHIRFDLSGRSLTSLFILFLLFSLFALVHSLPLFPFSLLVPCICRAENSALEANC
jgi:hypothetical protein